MSNFYVACDLGEEKGRVMLGALHEGELTISEIRSFPNHLIEEKNSLKWDVPQLYREILGGLRAIGDYDEPVSGISCCSWAGDYLLFDSRGSLLAPAYHCGDRGPAEGMRKVFSKISRETVYDETGVHEAPGNTLFQLANEKPRRLNQASHLLPVADGFNFLLAGVPRVEMSLACASQLFNPLTQAWSGLFLSSLSLPENLLPPVVPAGTKLGPLRPDIAAETGLKDTTVFASCSHELSAALVSLPAGKVENCAFLRLGPSAVMGANLAAPIINDASRESSFTNEIGFGGAVHFYKRQPGLWLLEECLRFWKEMDRGLDGDLIMHIAGSSPPFESLIDLGDPRFLVPGDMPLKIQAFCKETSQPVPRKPGSIFRCILESLALFYRRTLRDIEDITGRKITRLYLLHGSANPLMNHFIANALHVPISICPAPTDAAAVGNVLVQALALGHIKSLDDARELARKAFKLKLIVPRGNVWDAPHERLARLSTSPLCPAGAS